MLFPSPTGWDPDSFTLGNAWDVWLEVFGAFSAIIKRNSFLIILLKNFVVRAWNFVFDHRVSPLRNIPDVAVRHHVLQVLGLMWAVSFSVAIGSYTFLAFSILGHSVLIAATAITIATFTVAAKRPKSFMQGSGRRSDGEHE